MSDSDTGKSGSNLKDDKPFSPNLNVTVIMIMKTMINPQAHNGGKEKMQGWRRFQLGGRETYTQER